MSRTWPRGWRRWLDPAVDAPIIAAVSVDLLGVVARVGEQRIGLHGLGRLVYQGTRFDLVVARPQFTTNPAGNSDPHHTHIDSFTYCRRFVPLRVLKCGLVEYIHNPICPKAALEEMAREG